MIDLLAEQKPITRAAMLGLGLLMALLVITVPLDLNRQLAFAAGIILTVFIADRWKTRQATLFICMLTLVISTRYIFWRATYTLAFDNPLSALLGGALFLAEFYAWVILCLGVFQTVWPVQREIVPIEGDADRWPTVDVFIPTYNESLSIVRNTVFAAMAMDYPKSRFRVFLLDDGRRQEFQTFARLAGCGYLTRQDNRHAKAGNLNAAMTRTDGELILVFDCDHVPTRAFLQMTVGWFQRDPKLAMLQTPHHFYSPDPIQRNLRLEKDLPGEGELFYGPVQSGNDMWNATFFCGSCAVIRRKALADTHGFAGETVTEDAHTALKMQRMGWNTAYINIRLAAGLATERLALHIGQRVRWARGMTQIMRIDNPLFGPGLSLPQRLCYLNAMLHFQFPLPRLVFLLSPLAYLLGGQSVIRASAALIFAYALPHLYCTTRANARLQGEERRPFWGEIYETLLAFHLVKPTVFTLFDPTKGKFNVTSKGDVLDKSYFDFTSIRPHIIAVSLLWLGLAVGVVKLVMPAVFGMDLSTFLLNAAWTTYSIFILTAAISVAREARQSRGDVRIPVSLPTTVYFDDGYVTDGMTENMSSSGLALRLPDGFVTHGREIVEICLPVNDETSSFPVKMIQVSGSMARLTFAPLDLVDQRKLAIAMMGRADAWSEPVAQRKPHVSEMKSLFHIVSVLLKTRAKPRPQPASLARDHGMDVGVKLERSRRQPVPAAAGALAAVLFVAALATGHTAHAAPVATAPAAADTTKVQVAPSSSGTLQKRLSLLDMRVSSRVRLVGTQGEIGIPFGLRRDGVITSASLTLNLAYSPALIPELSHIVVLVNGEVVRSLALPHETADGMTVTIPLDPALFLPGDNQLNIRLVGHYTKDCEDPMSSLLWANVSNTRSWLDLTVQKLPPRKDLALLPAPFFDRYSGDPLRLPFVFAGQPKNEELEAAASVASWFGSLASYRGVQFTPSLGALPAGNAVVFAMPGRAPAGLDLAINGPSIAIVNNPADPFGLLLVVMGRNASELKLAAAALASNPGTLSGTVVNVDGVRVPVYSRYAAPRWIRTDRPVTLGELVDPHSLEGRGLPPGPLTAGFHLAPDLFFWPNHGGKLTTTYRYPTAPWLDRGRSRLDLSLNGQFLQTMPMAASRWQDQLFGMHSTRSGMSTAQATLPDYSLYGDNELSFFFDLQMGDRGRCNSQLPLDVKASIDPHSTIDLTGSYHATRLPNLAIFAGSGFPFTRTPDLGETLVVLSPTPTAPEIEAFLGLMGQFGDATGAGAYRVAVTQGYDSAKASGKDVLVIGTTAIASAPGLFDHSPIRMKAGRLEIAGREPIAFLESLFSPDKSDPPSAVDEALVTSDSFAAITSFGEKRQGGSVVSVLASRPELLPGLVYAMRDAKLNPKIQGDLSILTTDGFQSYHLGRRYWSGGLPIWISIGYAFSLHPLLMAFIALVVALLLSTPVYLLLANHQRRRMGSSPEQSDV